jgi:hypothetical protein
LVRLSVALSIFSVCLLSSNRVFNATHKCWRLKAPRVASREPSEAATLTANVFSIAQNIPEGCSCLAGEEPQILRVSGTACETLASSALRAVSPAVRRSCDGRLTFSPKFSIADCPAECSGRRSTKQTQALRHSKCGAGFSSLPSSRKSEEARHRAITRKDESPIECVWNTFTHERPPFQKGLPL